MFTIYESNDCTYYIATKDDQIQRRSSFTLTLSNISSNEVFTMLPMLK